MRKNIKHKGMKTKSLGHLKAHSQVWENTLAIEKEF